MKTAFVSFYQIYGTVNYAFEAEYRGVMVYCDYGRDKLIMGYKATAELRRQGFTHIKQKADNKQGFTVKKLGKT